MTLTQEHADQVLAAARAHAEQLGARVTIAVVDAGAHLLALTRHEDANLVSLDLAISKAYTAMVLREPSDAIAEDIRPGGPLHTLDTAHTPRPLISLPGGLPLGTPVIGAVGVSGGSLEVDTAIAEAGARILADNS
ncbi:hypothetical protein CH305_00440 [Rhodococcus sp. 15-649-2-2]|uniref:GlcG/HbpS family heme-binding protein n=1 Tax=Rhodococcus sp. 15-649-2-2 TaxID=2023140 RepID=UPI000B9B8D24|nr:heme-binding protein [Rhodococcus sp. 15-649-2-2]OZE88341.1 hypothetical protein CH305_00440 [Rhodococcus sp. 15-649-2-2]